MFDHKEGQDIDIGFMKIYMTSEYTDLRFLNQMGFNEGSQGRSKPLTDEVMGKKWDCIQFTIVSKK